LKLQRDGGREKMGRISNEKQAEVYELLAKGKAVSFVSEKTGVSEKTVQRMWDELDTPESKEESEGLKECGDPDKILVQIQASGKDTSMTYNNEYVHRLEYQVDLWKRRYFAAHEKLLNAGLAG
jgi:2,4-dienoyl-CoA reductase-like NADH-dependent reductase (Old Yellow Enzyme family)